MIPYPNILQVEKQAKDGVPAAKLIMAAVRILTGCHDNETDAYNEILDEARRIDGSKY